MLWRYIYFTLFCFQEVLSNTEILLEFHLQTMAAEMAKLEREHSEALQSLECERTERQRVETELKKSIHSIQHQKEVCSAYV